ncbi:cbb3-type cytochrome oxidase assembly protein CcoS [Chitinibacter sp. GC72]|uniref:cbb3-type cytochrome oxidase assembly protein CcoS n=1 Tax=Chitinibacter sp. GC72 TaxID=1526917 RepID=UPI0012FA3113|nr:cbb3-type cytochrome oxidase assembly protein CcoS [Chitinibacter sp. GC72]
MESLYLLIPLSILIAAAIAIVFWWFIRSGQSDDLEGPGWRILQDDDSIRSHDEKTRHTAEKNPD